VEDRLDGAHHEGQRHEEQRQHDAGAGEGLDAEGPFGP